MKDIKTYIGEAVASRHSGKYDLYEMPKVLDFLKRKGIERVDPGSTYGGDAKLIYSDNWSVVRKKNEMPWITILDIEDGRQLVLWFDKDAEYMEYGVVDIYSRNPLNVTPEQAIKRLMEMLK